MQVRLTVSVPVFPTEDPSLVRKAVNTIFPDVLLDPDGNSLVGEGSSVAEMKDIIARTKIRDSARSALLRSMGPDGLISFDVSKQAALVGRFTFAVDEPTLGAIHVEVRCDDPRALIESLAGKEEDG